MGLDEESSALGLKADMLSAYRLNVMCSSIGLGSEKTDCAGRL